MVHEWYLVRFSRLTLALSKRSIKHLSHLLRPISLQELVDELYHFRDCYFETHDVEEAGKKESDVAQELEKTLKTLEEKEGRCCVANPNPNPFSFRE